MNKKIARLHNQLWHMYQEFKKLNPDTTLAFDIYKQIKIDMMLSNIITDVKTY